MNSSHGEEHCSGASVRGRRAAVGRTLAQGGYDSTGVKNTADLGSVLKSLALDLVRMHEINEIELVFDPAAACDCVMPVLGAHALRLRPCGEYVLLFNMQYWMHYTCREEWAQETVRRYGRLESKKIRCNKNYPGKFPPEQITILVLNLLQMLGLQPRRCRGMRCKPDPCAGPDEHREYSREPLFYSEYIAVGMPGRNWAS